MGWTTPKTWATNELVTAAMLNTHLRDNLNFLFTPNFNEVAINNFSTTSTSYVDITGASVNITTTGGNLFVSVVGELNANGRLAVNIDGVDTEINSRPAITGILRRFTVGAGAHTVKLRLKTTGASASFSGDAVQRLIVAEGVV